MPFGLEYGRRTKGVAVFIEVAPYKIESTCVTVFCICVFDYSLVN